MDLANNNILTRLTRFPYNVKENVDFYEQMKAPQKIEVKNEKTGNIEYKYLEGNTPDHYAHANTYCEIAMHNHSPISVDSGSVTINHEQDEQEDYNDDFDDSFSSDF